MKHIVWTRIDDRLIHGQVMTQWIQYTEANEVLIIDDGVAKDSFLQMVMKSSVPGKISLKVLSVKDAIGYLNEDGKHEKIIILVKTPVVLDEHERCRCPSEEHQCRRNRREGRKKADVQKHICQ